jgi:hypothetical protein
MRSWPHAWGIRPAAREPASQNHGDCQLSGGVADLIPDTFRRGNQTAAALRVHSLAQRQPIRKRCSPVMTVIPRSLRNIGFSRFHSRLASLNVPGFGNVKGVSEPGRTEIP